MQPKEKDSKVDSTWTSKELQPLQTTPSFLKDKRRYIDEPLGTKEDFKKNRKRTFAEVSKNRVTETINITKKNIISLSIFLTLFYYNIDIISYFGRFRQVFSIRILTDPLVQLT